MTTSQHRWMRRSQPVTTCSLRRSQLLTAAASERATPTGTAIAHGTVSRAT